MNVSCGRARLGVSKNLEPGSKGLKGAVHE